MEDILMKAKERGYSVIINSSDYKWYSLYNETNKLNLQLYKNGEFTLSHTL